MISGSIAAVAHGAGWPVLNIFFGDMVDEFVEYDKYLPEPGEPFPTDIPPDVIQDAKEEFNEQTRKYSIIFAYVGTAIFVVSYIQVRINRTCVKHKKKHKLRTVIELLTYSFELFSWYLRCCGSLFTNQTLVRPGESTLILPKI